MSQNIQKLTNAHLYLRLVVVGIVLLLVLDAVLFVVEKGYQHSYLKLPTLVVGSAIAYFLARGWIGYIFGRFLLGCHTGNFNRFWWSSLPVYEFIN